MLCSITVVVAFWALWNGAACCDLRPPITTLAPAFGSDLLRTRLQHGA
jgi:hypothetical protein